MDDVTPATAAYARMGNRGPLEGLTLPQLEQRNWEWAEDARVIIADWPRLKAERDDLKMLIKHCGSYAVSQLIFAIGQGCSFDELSEWLDMIIIDEDGKNPELIEAANRLIEFADPRKE